MLTLTEALRTNKISEFVAQEEKRGIGPAAIAILALDRTCVKGVIPQVIARSPNLLISL